METPVCLLNSSLQGTNPESLLHVEKKKKKYKNNLSYPFSFCIPCYKPKYEFTVRNSNRKDFTNNNKQITLNIHITLKSRGTEN